MCAKRSVRLHSRPPEARNDYWTFAKNNRCYSSRGGGIAKCHDARTRINNLITAPGKTMPQIIIRWICFLRGDIGLLIIEGRIKARMYVRRGRWIVIVCHFGLLPVIIPIARHLHLFRYCSHIFTDYDCAIAVILFLTPRMTYST